MTQEEKHAALHLTHPDGYCEGCGDTPCTKQNNGFISTIILESSDYHQLKAKADLVDEMKELLALALPHIGNSANGDEGMHFYQYEIRTAVEKTIQKAEALCKH